MTNICRNSSSTSNSSSYSRYRTICEKVDDIERDLINRQITWIHNRLESRVQHLIKLDTSYLDQWDQVVFNPAENAVSHLLDNTLPSIQINHDHWDEQSIS